MSKWLDALPAAVEAAQGVKDWRRTTAYRLWRVIVIQRDGSCVICNSRKGRAAHHVSHASYYPELRFDVDNGVCLCGKCHMRYHCDFHRSTRVKCTEYDFMNFVKLACHFHDMYRAQAIIVTNTHFDSYGTYDKLRALASNAQNVQMAFHTSPDSVVGYVAELASLRRPA